jgi:hypothetical protein
MNDAQLQALVDKEMIAISPRLCELCLTAAVTKARAVVGEHYRFMLQEGYPADVAAPVAARCAARISAEVQELEAHRQTQPTRDELDAIVKRVSAKVKVELYGRLN